MQIFIDNKNYDDFQYLDLKVGVNIAVHAVILKFTPIYSEIFKLGDRVFIKENEVILLQGSITTIETSKDYVSIIALSYTNVVNKKALQENKLKKITTSSALNYIKGLKFYGVKEKIIDNLNISLNEDFLYLLDKISLKTKQRYYSLDNTVYFFTEYSLINPLFIDPSLIISHKKITNSKNIFTYVTTSETVSQTTGVYYKVFDRYNYTADESKNAVEVLNANEDEKKEYILLELHLNNANAFYPLQNVVLDGRRYIVKTARYIIDKYNKKCEIQLIKFNLQKNIASQSQNSIKFYLT